MQKIPLAHYIKNQIRKEIKKITKIDAISARTSSEWDSLYAQGQNALINDSIEKTLLPILSILFDRRLASGGEPVKITSNSLKVFIGHLLACFGQENVFELPAQEITLTSYAEDRWVYIYLCPDKTFVVNKYSPIIGSNAERIVICKVWVEKNATDYNAGMIRDLRQVGVASGNLNHVLRQTFLHLMQSIPATVIDSISVIPYTYESGEAPSGNGGLNVKVGSTSDKLFYAKLNPIPDTIVEIIKPVSGTKNYYIVCSAQVSTDDPDDFTWNIKAIVDTQSLQIYEIPIAIVKGITNSTTAITSSMIKTIGYQRTKDDYFDYTLEFKQSGTLSAGYIDLPQVVQYQSKIYKVLIYLGKFDCTTILESGLVASLNFKIKVNEENKFNFSIYYDKTKESEIVYNKLVSSLLESGGEDNKITPEDIVKIEMTITLPSGYSFTIENIVIKLLCSKMYY